MTPDLRSYFDELLERVLAELPESIHTMLDETPLYVEDYPDERIMRQFEVKNRKHFCGLYTGVPLTERRVEMSGIPSDVIRVYREGVIAKSMQPSGRLEEAELLRQIRITLLHEIGHHYGLDEDDLEELGYA